MDAVTRNFGQATESNGLQRIGDTARSSPGFNANFGRQGASPGFSENLERQGSLLTGVRGLPQQVARSISAAVSVSVPRREELRGLVRGRRWKTFLVKRVVRS